MPADAGYLDRWNPFEHCQLDVGLVRLDVIGFGLSGFFVFLLQQLIRRWLSCEVGRLLGVCAWTIIGWLREQTTRRTAITPYSGGRLP